MMTMMRSYTKNGILPFLLLLGLLLSCSDGSRMRQLMDDAESRNRCYESLADDSALFAVAEWMDRHGTSNERMRAHYLAAAVYRDRGQAPEALEALQTAAQCADTTAADCDYHTLSRVHGQMAELFYDQLLPYEAIAEEKHCQHYALKDRDTLMWLVSFEKQSQALYLAGQVDSAIATDIAAYEMAKDIYGQTMAANYIETTLLYLVETGRIEQARQYIDIFETYSDYFDREVNEPLHGFYYYTKGTFYAASGKNDSALACFRKLLTEKEPQMLEGAYKGLYLTYLKTAQSDSAAKYADLCYRTSDQIYREASTDELRKMQALYNYTSHQRRAHQKEREADEARLIIIAVLSISSFLILLLLFILFRQRAKRELQVEMLTREYEHQIERVRRAQQDLVAATLEEYRQKSEKELADSQHRLMDLLGIQETPAVDLSDNEVYDYFRSVVSRPATKVPKSQWKALERLFDEKLPAFRQTLTRGKSITESDLHLCMLIRMQFGVAEICAIMNTYSQYVSTRRSRLLTKYFNIKGKPEDFDRILMTIN